MENGDAVDSKALDKLQQESLLLGPSLSNQSEKKMLEAEEDNEEEEHPEREYLCGVGDCRPGLLQPLANLKCFTMALSFLMIFGSMNFTYYIAVLTQIEKEFGLSSTMTGFIKNIDNIGYMSSVLLVTHFCRYTNKPRLFCAANIVGAVAVFLFAMPYFLYGSTDPMTITIATDNGTKEYPGTCVQNENLEDYVVGQCGEGKGKSLLLRPFNAGALGFFVVSELVQGMASSPKYALTITYMDDNARKNSPAYFGFLFGMRAFAPILGFALGAWTNSLYVDLTEPDISQKDPRWVGAWWLGFVICSACSFTLALPLVFFPARFKEQDEASSRARVSKLDVTSQTKDLPRALFRLIKNPVYVAMICGSCFNFFLMGFSSFTPKYLETYFGLTASRASLLTGIISLLSFCLGPIISGQVVSRIKMDVAGMLKFLMCTNAIAVLGFTIMMLLHCPDKEFAGSLRDLDFSDSCNFNCTCQAVNYKPVCGDGVNYFSPCHAGCLQELPDPDSNYKIYEDCACVESQQATEGLCEKDCQATFIAYMVTMGLSKFAASMTVVPYLTVVMRSAADKDKGIAVGLSSALSMIVSFPSAMLFGLAIDWTCIIYQSSCDRKGACLFYDTTSFRLAFHGIAVFIKCGAFLLYSLALILTLRRNRNQKTEAEHAVEEEVKLNTKNKSDDENSTGNNEKDINKNGSISEEAEEHLEEDINCIT